MDTDKNEHQKDPPEAEKTNGHNHSKGVKVSVVVVGGIVVMIAVFTLGAAAGRRSTGRFGAMVIGQHMMADNYELPVKERSIGRMGKHGGMVGVNGQVSTVSGSAITVKQDAKDVSVAVLDTTSIYKAGVIAKLADVAVGDLVIVKGLPNSSGVVQASAIFIQ